MKNLFCIFILLASITFGMESKAFGVDNIIDEIPPTGILINTPGTYTFRKSLSWHPEADGSAITILANDVTLDMQGHSLKSAATNFKTIGISALASENLQILDGKIKNMGLAGIQCTFCANVSIKKLKWTA